MLSIDKTYVLKKVCYSMFEAPGSGILGCEFRMLGSGPGLRVWDLGFRVEGLGLRVLGLRVRDLGFALRF